MKIQLHFKTPDVIDYAVWGQHHRINVETLKEKLKKYIKYDEQLIVEFDTETETMTIIEQT